MNFDQALQFGQIGEGYIATWFRQRGYHVLPVYEKEIDNGKGPRLFMAQRAGKEQLIAPDLLILGKGKFVWVEAKQKTHFTWYGKGKYWTTGIDLRHYRDYLDVREETALPVWLFFLHTNNITSQTDIERWNAPAECPVGLFGNELLKLKESFSHQSPHYGPTGMIYWSIAALRLIAPLASVIPAAAAVPFLIPQPQWAYADQVSQLT